MITALAALPDHVWRASTLRQLPGDDLRAVFSQILQPLITATVAAHPGADPDDVAARVDAQIRRLVAERAELVERLIASGAYDAREVVDAPISSLRRRRRHRRAT